MAAGGNFRALAVKLAASKGPNVQKSYSRAGSPRPNAGYPYNYKPPVFYNKPGSNASGLGGRLGIGGVPGYKSVEPRVSRPKVGGKFTYGHGYRYRV